jgi:hypothetical protein
MHGRMMDERTMNGRMDMSGGGSGDTAYRSALRNCAAGPANQRDACLDSAISRFRKG